MQAHVTRQHFVGISRFPASGSHCVSDIDYLLLLMLKTKGVSKMQRLFSARSAEFADRQEKTIFDRGRVVLFTSVEMLSRVLIFLFGLVVLSLGIATVTHAGLGTGTVSSAAIVLSRQTGLSMGLFVFLTNVFFFVLQCLVDPKSLLIKAVKQLPVCAFFGAVFDVAMWLTSFMDPTNYGWAFMQVFFGYVSDRARCFGDGLCPFAGVAAGRFCDRCHASLRRIVRHNSHDSRRVSCDSVRHDEFVLFRYGLRCSRRNADFRAFCGTYGQRISQTMGAAVSAAPSD